MMVKIGIPSNSYQKDVACASGGISRYILRLWCRFQIFNWPFKKVMNEAVYHTKRSSPTLTPLFWIRTFVFANKSFDFFKTSKCAAKNPLLQNALSPWRGIQRLVHQVTVTWQSKAILTLDKVKEFRVQKHFDYTSAAEWFCSLENFAKFKLYFKQLKSTDFFQ